MASSAGSSPTTPGSAAAGWSAGSRTRTHFTHLRWFDSIDSYEECTRAEGYVAHTELMYEHLRPYDSYPREYAEVVLDEPGNPAP